MDNRLQQVGQVAQGDPPLAINVYVLQHRKKTRVFRSVALLVLLASLNDDLRDVAFITGRGGDHFMVINVFCGTSAGRGECPRLVSDFAPDLCKWCHSQNYTQAVRKAIYGTVVTSPLL